MEANGRMLQCDRCGKTLFLKWIGEDVFDGGYTRRDKFEAPPEGWECVNRYFHKHDLRKLCPDCSKEYEAVLDRYFNESEGANDE